MIKKLFFACFLNLVAISLATADELIIEPDMGRTPILSKIYHAHSSIDLVMYGFTDKTILKSLLNANENGKKIRVLIEPHPYKSEGENDFSVQQFNFSHLPFHFANSTFPLTHEKMLLLDQQEACIFTFNFTHSAFTKERNFGLCITDPLEINEIQSVFDQDWKGKNSDVKQSALVWSPNNSREKLLHFLRSAKSTIDIYAPSLSDYETIGALANAAHSRVTVRILLSKQTHPYRKALRYLQRAGVKLFFSKNKIIHAKVIIIDHQRALLGSMNLTRASIDKNRELSIITENPTVIYALENTFQADLSNTTKEYENGFS